MSRYFKSILLSISPVLVYVLLQMLLMYISRGINFKPVDYSKPETWAAYVYLNKLFQLAIGRVVPIILCIILYSIIIKFVYKENIHKRYGFSTVKFKILLSGFMLGISVSILFSLVFNNSLWNDIIFNNNLGNLISYLNMDLLIIIRNTLIIDLLEFIPIFLIVPMFEEILFRGLVLNELNKTFSTLFSVLIQAVLFGVLHLGWQQAVKAFSIGILLALVFVKVKSIWVTFIVHSFYNLTTITFLKISETNKLFDFSENYNTTDVIDTFVYNSLNGSEKPVISNLPLFLNIAFIAIVLVIIAVLLIYIFKSKSKHYIANN